MSDCVRVWGEFFKKKASISAECLNMIAANRVTDSARCEADKVEVANSTARHGTAWSRLEDQLRDQADKEECR